MANEINVAIQVSCRNGAFLIPQLGEGHAIDQAVAGGGAPGYVIVGTSKVDVDLSVFTKPGILYARNLGYLGTGTNGDPVITWGPKSGGNLIPCGDIKYGEEMCWRITGTTPTLSFVSDQEDSAVQLVILED